MKKIVLLLLLVGIAQTSLGQDTQYYQNDREERHLCGPFDIEILENDSPYKQWYDDSYEDFDLEKKNRKWAKELDELEVDIYLGTWCGDSKNWVPKFVKTWDQLGLDRNQLNFIALYDRVDGQSKYKQGPDREETDKRIHRVPTFIFKSQGQEIARIVETPVNDLETDLAQIALGFPSDPNYRGASYLLDLFDKENIDEIKGQERKHLYAVYDLINGNRRELNTLGYVLLEAGRLEEALLTFYFNTRYFKFDPNVYDSYAEALALDGQVDKAIDNYEKALLLDRSNTGISEEIKRLKSTDSNTSQ